MNKNNSKVYTSFKKDDEYYTFYGDIKYFLDKLKLDHSKFIWLPFDKENSNFVNYLWKESNYNFIATHIDTDLVSISYNGNWIQLKFEDLRNGDFYEITINDILDLLKMCDINVKLKDIVVISNPPFSNKTKLIGRLISQNISFALLLPNQTFNVGGVVRILKDVSDKVSVFYLINRIQFFKYDNFGKPYKTDTPFHSLWMCYNLDIASGMYFFEGYHHNVKNKNIFFE